MISEYRPAHATAQENWQREVKTAFNFVQKAIEHMHDATNHAYGYTQLISCNHASSTAAWTLVDVAAQLRRVLNAVAVDQQAPEPQINTASRF